MVDTDSKKSKFLSPAEITALVDTIALETEREKLRPAHLPALRERLLDWHYGMAAGTVRPRRFIEFRDLDRLGLPPVKQTLADPQFVAAAKYLVQEAVGGLQRPRSQFFQAALRRLPLRLRVVQEIMNECGTVNAVLDDARATLVSRNNGLAYTAANQFRHLVAGRIEPEDLVQEALAGLHEATALYRDGRGGNFATYAAAYAQAFVRRAITNTADTVRLPVHMNGEMAAVAKAVREFGGAAADQQLAAAAGLSLKRFRAARTAISLRQMQSLDAPLPGADGEEGDTLLDIVADREAVPVDEIMADKERRELLIGVLTRLKPRQERVLRLRFGIGGARRQKLWQIAEQIGCTPERVRQIERESLQDLRALIGRMAADGDAEAVAALRGA